MLEFQSKDAKGNWGVITNTALQEPVTITRQGKPALVMTSAREYEELQHIKYEALKANVSKGFEQLDRGEYSTRNIDDIKDKARSILTQDS